MESIAWILRTDVKRHTMGFVRPSDLSVSFAHHTKRTGGLKVRPYDSRC